MSRRTDRLVAVALIGGAAVVTGMLALASLYLGIIGQAVSGIPRGEPLPEYDGRPAAPSAGGVQPQNYLILTVDADDALTAALVGHLSAGRERLDLVALPTNLKVVARRNAGARTLGELWADRPALLLQGIESLLDVRMDHQVVVSVPRVPALIDAVGGLSSDGTSGMTAVTVAAKSGGSPPPPDRGLAAYLAADEPVLRLERTTAVLSAVVARLAEGAVLSDSSRLERVTNVLIGCLTVDEGLTPEAARQTALGLRFGGGSFASTPIPVARAQLEDGVVVLVADPAELAQLRDALKSDTLAGFTQSRPDAWDWLRSLPTR